MCQQHGTHGTGDGRSGHGAQGGFHFKKWQWCCYDAVVRRFEDSKIFKTTYHTENWAYSNMYLNKRRRKENME